MVNIIVNDNTNISCRRCRVNSSFSNPKWLGGDLAGVIGKYQVYIHCLIIIESIDDHPCPDLACLNLKACVLHADPPDHSGNNLLHQNCVAVLA